MRTLAIACALLAAAGAAEAEIKIMVRADGTRVVYNDGADVRRPTSRPVRLRPVGDLEIEALIDEHARTQRLDARLVQAVIQVESSYDRRAVSKKGAIGLMQLMPATARVLAVDDPFDPAQNVRGGTTYLRRLLDRFERLELALAAYNAGPTAVERYGGIPPYRETRDYVRRVLTLYQGWAPELTTGPGLKVQVERDRSRGLVVTTAAGG